MAAVWSGDPTIAFTKSSYDGTPDGDFATRADIAAQDACEAIRAVVTPWAGAIGEEKGLRIPCTLPGKPEWYAYWTFDGCDGSRHFQRLDRLVKAGHKKGGVASMVAFVWDGEVVAAAVGDVFKRVIYLLDPVSGTVFEYDVSNNLAPANLSARVRTETLTGGLLLRRGNRDGYHPLVAGLIDGHFPNWEYYATESFGVGMSRLWTDVVTVHVQGGGVGHVTPWDDTPVIGINRALKMVYLRPSPDGEALEEFVPQLVTGDPVARPLNTVVLYYKRIAQLRQLVPVRMLAGT
jgi:hypothetical protein